MGEALEVADLDLRALLSEPVMRFRLPGGVTDVAGGVVQVQAQARTELAELPDDVGFVEVVCEDIEAEALVGECLGDEVEDQPMCVEAEPLILRLIGTRVEVEGGR